MTARCVGKNGPSCRTELGSPMIRTLLLLVASLPLLISPALHAQTAEPVAQRPRVALVLSGGGARGFAHVGVLRALQYMRVPVDIVVGASMGAVVGGAYAAGRSVEELEQFVRGTDWDSVVADRVQRGDLSFRRKEDDLELPSRLEFGLGRSGLRLPPAAASNAELEVVLTRLLPADAVVRPLSALPLPFRAVATDLLTGDLVELAETPLFQSLRASMAVPGVFAPLRLVDGETSRLVVDGGLVRNLPVDLARAMGATIIIAVNVGTPLAGADGLTSGLGVAQQMLNILTEQNVQRSIKELGADDVLIAPELRGIGFLDFNAAERAMRAGERAALAMAPRLAALVAPEEVYALREATRLAPRPDRDLARPLAKLEVKSTAFADGRALAAETGLEIGEGITMARAQRAAARLFGRGDFERVETRMADGAQGRELTITPTEAEGARSRVRLGLELSSDFRDDHRITVSALHLLSWINPWGGELRTIARIGSSRSLSTQWWQPLGAGSPWFAQATAEYDTEPLDLFVDGRRTARASVTTQSMSASLGYQFGSRASLHAGVLRTLGRGRVLLPETATDVSDIAETTRFVSLRYDTLNSLAFPTEGSLFVAQLQSTPAPGRSVTTLAQSSVQGLSAIRLGEWGGHVYGEWAKSRSGFAPLRLGGFLRLTGAPRDSVTGATVLFGRVVVARRIGQMPPGLGGAIRTGMSLELGTGYAENEAIRAAKLRPAASAFISVDTRFGPAYLGMGATSALGSTVYVFLGPYW